MSDGPMVIYLFTLIQIILVGLGSWSLVTTIRMQTRVTKVETLLEASLMEDVKDLKRRVREIESTIRHPAGSRPSFGVPDHTD